PAFQGLQTPSNSVKFGWRPTILWLNCPNQGTLGSVAEGGCLSVRGPCAPTEHGSPGDFPPRALQVAPSNLPPIADASASGGVFVVGRPAPLSSPRSWSPPMAKRAARRAKLHAIDSARIHNLVFDHTPANDRDQSYIRKIRPRSDNQRILMEA